MATIRVPQDFTTIAAAVASATAGDTIEVDASYAGGETFVSVYPDSLKIRDNACNESVLGFFWEDDSPRLSVSC